VIVTTLVQSCLSPTDAAALGTSETDDDPNKEKKSKIRFFKASSPPKRSELAEDVARPSAVSVAMTSSPPPVPPGPPPPDTEPIAPGWREIVSDNGEIYYWNDETGKSLWEKPLASAPPPPPAKSDPPASSNPPPPAPVPAMSSAWSDDTMAE